MHYACCVCSIVIGAYSVNVGGKLAGEDEAVNALLQTRDVHDLHKVALHSAKLLRIAHSLVFGVLTLHIQSRHSQVLLLRVCGWGRCWGEGGAEEWEGPLAGLLVML